MTSLDVQIQCSIHEIEPAIWDRLSAGRGFQSRRWYAFGERAMADCPPAYLIARQDGNPIAAAALFQIKNEPLPIPKAARSALEAYFRRKPMLVCRSPLADTSGLLLPETPARAHALTALANAARREIENQRGSFLLFDFLPASDLTSWTPGFIPITVSDPGTSMMPTHESFEAYLAADKKTRNDYHHTIRKAEENGLRLTRHTHVDDIDAALELIRRVAGKHNSPPNPWMRGLLVNLAMIDATWFEVRKESELVGCIVTLRDNGVQSATALGVAEVPFAYFMLIYAAIKEAFDRKVKQFRLGSGAYDVKRRLGFQREDANHAMVAASGSLPRLLTWFASGMKAS